MADDTEYQAEARQIEAELALASWEAFELARNEVGLSQPRLNPLKNNNSEFRIPNSEFPTAGLAPWRSPLARALHRHRSQPHSRFLQLATVTPEGLPANRTVVFRGFLAHGNQLKFVTDARSHKVAHLTRCPQAEACWYFSRTREQFRLQGPVAVVGSGESDPALGRERRLAWQNLSDAARRQFTWPPTAEVGGEPLEDGGPDRISATDPLPNFSLLLLAPHRVEHLELRGEPHHRWLYRLQEAGTWEVRPIDP